MSPGTPPGDAGQQMEHHIYCLYHHFYFALQFSHEFSLYYIPTNLFMVNPDGHQN